MELYKAGVSSTSGLGATEFEILKSSHKFIREEDEGAKNASWDQQLAKKYYSSLYREYAICNLKHYKSGNFSLRWRTEDEVISGAGETTCGNTRCPLHSPRNLEESHPALKTLELPFSYTESGEDKFALVKVVLCNKCCRKLMWKRNQDKALNEQSADAPDEPTLSSTKTGDRGSERSRHNNPARIGSQERALTIQQERRRSRSQSPKPNSVPRRGRHSPL